MKGCYRVFRWRMTLTVFVIMLSGVAFSSIEDKVLRFSTPGIDRYADGSAVVDGECYALVWSPAGKGFSGFNADGTTVSPGDRVVLAGALAKDGKCRDALFQIPAEEYKALEIGNWAVCLVDTRNLAGVPLGARNGKPLRVNRWGVVPGGVEIKEPGSADFGAAYVKSARLAASSAGEGDGGVSARPVRATTLSAVPPGIRPPKITAMEISDDEVVLAVEDTEPYLSYVIESGATPSDLKADYFSDVVDGESGAEVVIGTQRTANRRFFRVTRAK
ncbi:MAG: hypothetical protein IKF72_06240 [Kiritimatiellae bacterium]|nr:hypothetical protein [Kiritimatiellia bacterium]